jgi:hypothetical protein
VNFLWTSPISTLSILRPVLFHLILRFGFCSQNVYLHIHFNLVTCISYVGLRCIFEYFVYTNDLNGNCINIYFGNKTYKNL